MAAGSKVRALDTPTLLRLLKVAPSTLNYWVNRGFCHPTLDAGHGRRATRYWTIEDLVVLRSIKELRAAGCSLQLLDRAEKRLRESFGRNLASAVLYYDGADVLVLEEGVVVSLIKQAGQAVFAETVQIAAFPLRPWVEEAAPHTAMVDVSKIRDRRNATLARRRTA